MNKPSLLHLTALLLFLLVLAVTGCAWTSPAAESESAASTAASRGETTDDPATQEGGEEAAVEAPPEESAGDGSTQVSEEGDVRIEVTWIDRSQPVFEVTMNTHSVELDGYDLLNLARLRTAEGQEIAPSGWDAPPGGHHRSGMLSFPTTDAAGNPIPGEGPGTLELVVRDVAGVPERRFQWDY